MLEKDNGQVALSLCIPTNGVTDWVEPVLESIYGQDVAEEAFEVVVTDNGDNADFYDMMQRWCIEHNNIRYRKTTAQGFLNQIECFRDAAGEYIKFVNHRMMLKNRALQHFLDFVTTNRENKPICYFLNGCLPLPELSQYDDFDGFVRGLSYYSSWSAGLGIWKTDFIGLAQDLQYNPLFPHTTVLLKPYAARTYIIDNSVLMESLPENHPKGRYNLFHAFAVEYPSIIVDLLRQNHISLVTALQVKKELLTFLAELYLKYKIFRRKCSYDLSRMEYSICIYYNCWQLWKECVLCLFRIIIGKLFRTVKNLRSSR